MRIAQIIKAKKLKKYDAVLVFDADGKPSWNRVMSVNREYHTGYINVNLEGIKDTQDVEGKSRVVVWR